jgi:hypothetical protein
MPMNPLPRIASFLTVLLCCAPLLTGGANLFQRDGNAEIYRKAKRYHLVPIEEAVPEAFICRRCRP